MKTTTAYKSSFEYVPSANEFIDKAIVSRLYDACQLNLLPGVKKMINFSDYIVDALLEMQHLEGYTVTEMAERVGISKQYMSNILNRKKRVGRKTALKIASTFDIDLNNKPDNYPTATEKDAEMIETLKEMIELQKREIARLQAEVEAYKNPQSETEGLA